MLLHSRLKQNQHSIEATADIDKAETGGEQDQTKTKTHRRRCSFVLA